MTRQGGRFPSGVRTERRLIDGLIVKYSLIHSLRDPTVFVQGMFLR